MTHDQIESELSRLNDRRNELEESLKQARAKRDREGAEVIRRELKILANRVRHFLFKLGKYRYPEDEQVEYEQGQFMSANDYHMLKD